MGAANLIVSLRIVLTIEPTRKSKHAAQWDCRMKVERG